MENAMVERVARAIDLTAFTEGAWLGSERGEQLDRQSLARRAARRAIAAMREPTEAMLDASFMDDGRGGDLDWPLAQKAWRAMIDAALEPQKTEV